MIYGLNSIFTKKIPSITEMLNFCKNVENKFHFYKLLSLSKNKYKFSTQIIQKDAKDEIIKTETIQKTPFMKELFLGNFDKDILAFPEVLNEKQLSDLDLKANNLKDIISVEPQLKNENKIISNETLMELKSTGLFGSNVPKKFGGLGMNTTQFCKFNEGLIPSVANLNCSQFYGISSILEFGTDEQKEKYLPQIATGDHFVSFCLKEPTGGTEPTTIECTAILDNDDYWHITGTKSWVFNGSNADQFIVFANSQPDINISKISCFLIDKSFGNITISEPVNVIGNQGWNIVNVHFNETKVPRENLLGAEGQGFNLALSIINKYRLIQAIPFLDVFKNLINKATNYSINTNRFKYNLKDNKIIQKKLVNASINAYILESMIYLTTGIIDQYDKSDCDIESAIIKVFAMNNCLKSAYTLLEIFNEDSVIENNEYYQLVNDMRTPLLLEANQDVLYSFISLMGLRHAGKYISEKVIKRRNPLMNPGYIVQQLFKKKNFKKKENCEYLEQFLHPSLQYSGKQLEFCTALFAHTVETVLIKYGGQIHHEHAVTQRIAKIAIHLYAMTAVLSRASRSYCIGLRNTDSEIHTAINYCHQAEERIKYHIMRIEEGITSIADFHYDHISERLFNNFSYLFEHPLKRNF